MMESYQDSCFIYDRKHKIGSCLYGSPCFWVNRDYRKARSYFPSFFDESGKYLFCDLGGELLSSINDLVLDYDHAIMHIESPGSVPEPFHGYFRVQKCRIQLRTRLSYVIRDQNWNPCAKSNPLFAS